MVLSIKGLQQGSGVIMQAVAASKRSSKQIVAAGNPCQHSSGCSMQAVAASKRCPQTNGGMKHAGHEATKRWKRGSVGSSQAVVTSKMWHEARGGSRQVIGASRRWEQARGCSKQGVAASKLEQQASGGIKSWQQADIVGRKRR